MQRIFAIVVIVSIVASFPQFCLGAQLKPITGTFIDVQYDARLKYVNNHTRSFTCEQWQDKISELSQTGVEVIVFQAVHDNRWGSYYQSSLHPYANLTCGDVVDAIMTACDDFGIDVFLSCEYTNDENDNVQNKTLMDGRLAIMEELSHVMVPKHKSFVGWYFSSEAYITPYFQDDFITYVHTLSKRARQLTPGCKTFASPYGTRNAVFDGKFVSQLVALDLDVIAYQDEVGCVRDEFPVVTSGAAFKQLAKAHAQTNTTLWGNVESFTWEHFPNNVTSALIPAAFPRIVAQLQAVADAGVERVMTFTMQGMYDKPSTRIPWGFDPPAHREFNAYADAFLTKMPSPYMSLLGRCMTGKVDHAAQGHAVAVTPAPAAPYTSGDLTDGITGAQTQQSSAWLGFPWLTEVTIVVDVDMGSIVDLSGVAMRFLQNPAASVYLPHSVTFSTSINGKDFTQMGHSIVTQWWEQECHDIRTEIYFSSPTTALPISTGTNSSSSSVLAPVAGRFVRATVFAVTPSWVKTCASVTPPPPHAQGPHHIDIVDHSDSVRKQGAGTSWVLADELMINPPT